MFGPSESKDIGRSLLIGGALLVLGGAAAGGLAVWVCLHFAARGWSP